MQTWAIVLIVVAAILAGFFIGIIFQRIRRHKDKTVGNLIVADSETDKEPPYIYLELHKDVEIVCSKRVIVLNVKRISHK